MDHDRTMILRLTGARRLLRLWAAGALGVFGIVGTLVLLLGWGARAPGVLVMVALATNLALLLCLAPAMVLQFGQRRKAGY
jgi:hypothetical protein